MPLATGELPNSPFTAKIVSVPYPDGDCPQSPEDLRKWFDSFGVQFSTTGVAFGYTAGTLDTATPNDQILPRLLFDDQQRFLGLAVWSTNLGAWSTGALIGETKTIIRSAATVMDDMEQKGLLNAGWHLMDGNTAGVPDYHAKDGWFSGAGPNYDVYTVCYTGS